MGPALLAGSQQPGWAQPRARQATACSLPGWPPEAWLASCFFLA